MVRLVASIVGVGVETADMLVREVLSRDLRDRRAVARYAGLTGSPDESGSKRREKGLAKAGNARVRRGLIQLAWRFLLFQKDSALAQWYRARTGGVKGVRKTVMIVALARKLLISLWRMVTTGEVPEGVRCGRSRPDATGADGQQVYSFGTPTALAWWVADDDPRRWQPEHAWLATPAEEWARCLGASLTEAHGCFMVRIPGGSYRIQGRGARFARTGGLPRFVWVPDRPDTLASLPCQLNCNASRDALVKPTARGLRP